MLMIEQTDRISFGLFELDLAAGELWRAGHKVRLASQPFKVLTTLVAKPGEVVTREELQAKVWGDNVNIDFERALAGAVNKVREALGDSAENPRFIQTLTKRGYRFIAPVTFVRSPQKTAVVAPPGESEAETHEAAYTHPAVAEHRTDPFVGEVASSRSKPDRRRFLPLLLPIGLAALAFGLALVVVWFWKLRPDPGPLEIDQLTHTVAISAGPPNRENLLNLATDGNRILTSVMEGGRPRLSAISIGTGEVQNLPLPQELASSVLTDISRDGTRLLLKSHSSSASEQALWVVPSSGGSALRVGGVLAHDAAWMPDGASILYANGNDLAVIRLDDGVSTPFAKLNGRAFWMRWSPDGKVLRYTLQDPVSHNSGIWEMQSAGETPRRLLGLQEEQGAACCGSWTSDGSAYILQVGDNLWQLKGHGFTSSLSQLTNGPLRYLSPVTARIGSRIYFIGLDRPFGMQQFDARQGFHPAPAFLANASRVDYSRDGVWVAWTDNDQKLWRARAADGSDKVQLTPRYLEVFMAHWSPDSSRLAVMAREPGKVWRTYLVNADGGTPQPVLNENRNAADPGWSADGQSLVFGREPDLMGKESGSHAIQIVHLANMQTEMLPDSEGMFSPRWSPDGRWIVALSLNQQSVMIYDVAARRWKELARTSAADPIWSADSKAVYIHAFLAEKQPILKIDVPDGGMHVIADLNGFRDPAIVSYFFGGVTPANELLVQPKNGTGDLYTLDLKTR
ncbi:WD40-like Beta Propeller Repeat [Granulicella rosea]|uniref:WD40-like Beta Propeller Repeat n=1 Tax=Granulicella rosea TaxID=474952 RepID=A0A239MJE1_9BACT|nr:winged helix-turn-helix domain-containing protein [Granulicella rosea]SNT42765.1 WD40-like Beta Propeller Repeat [Granulicella rosea]